MLWFWICTHFFFEPIQSSFREVSFRYGFLTGILIKLVRSKTIVSLTLLFYPWIFNTDRLFLFRVSILSIHCKTHTSCVIVSPITFTATLDAFWTIKICFELVSNRSIVWRTLFHWIIVHPWSENSIWTLIYSRWILSGFSDLTGKSKLFNWSLN